MLKISLFFSFFCAFSLLLPRVTSTWQFTNVTNTFSWHSFKGEKRRKVRRLTLKHRVLKKGTTPTNSAWHIRISNVYLYLFSRTFMRLWAIKSNFLKSFSCYPIWNTCVSTHYLFEKEYNFLSKCSFSDVLFVQKLWGERGVTQQKNPLGISNRTNSFS